MRTTAIYTFILSCLNNYNYIIYIIIIHVYNQFKAFASKAFTLIEPSNASHTCIYSNTQSLHSYLNTQNILNCHHALPSLRLRLIVSHILTHESIGDCISMHACNLKPRSGASLLVSNANQHDPIGPAASLSCI